MVDFNEIDKRVSVLEVEFINMKNSLESLDEALLKNNELTLAIKERIDKQNGILPHMAESVRLMSTKQEKMMERLNENSINNAKYSTKLRVLWGILGAVGTGFVTLFIYLLKSIVG